MADSQHRSTGEWRHLVNMPTHLTDAYFDSH